ncbi:MAG TPA: hypothetical protein VKV95_11485 [Terriglobia bacterium]|nr:hypothetical protein [Terriglobia bacterium]
MTKLPQDILDLPLEVRAEMAMKDAVEKVIDDHIRSGRPIHIWRDGKVVEVSAEELRAQRTRPSDFTPTPNP